MSKVSILDSIANPYFKIRPAEKLDITVILIIGYNLFFIEFKKCLLYLGLFSISLVYSFKLFSSKSTF